MATTLEIEAKVETKDAKSSVESLTEKIDELIGVQKESQLEAKKGAEATTKAMKQSTSATKGLAKGFRGVGLAMKAAGIGLAIAALGALKEVFMQNQAIADTVATSFEVVSIVFNDIVTAVVSTVKAVSETTGGFESLQAVVGGLITIALTPLKLAFKGIEIGVLTAMRAWESSFLGGNDKDKIKELTLDLITAQGEIIAIGEAAVDAGVDVATNYVGMVSEISQVVVGVVDKVKEISIESAIATAKTNVQLKNSALIAAAGIQGLIEKFDRLAEKQRQVRDDDKKSIAERILANEELGRILNKQAKEQVALANIRVKSAQAELNKNKTNIEAQVAYMEALNEVAAIEAQVEGFRSEQLVNRNSLLREQSGILKELQGIGKDEDDTEKLRLEQEREERLRQIDLAIEDEINKNELKLAVESDYQAGLLSITQKNDKIRIANEKKVADINTATIARAFSIASQLAGDNAEAGKGIAAAQALFNTYQAITGTLAAFSTVPIPGYAIASAVATGVFGLLQVQKILSTNSQSASGGGSVSGGGGSISTPRDSGDTLAPNVDFFNEGVGGSQNSRFSNMRAYVVSEEITDEAALTQRLQDLQRVG